MTGDPIGLGGFIIGALWLVGVSALFLAVVVALLVSRRGRAWFASRPPLLIAILVVLALPAALSLATWGPALVTATARQHAQDAEDHPAVEATTVVAGVAFPKGSVLTYQRHSDGSRDVVGVRPPRPVAAGGLELSEVRLSELDPREITLRLAGDQRIEDWPCSASEWVSFYSIDPNRPLSPDNWTFISCRLPWDFKPDAVPLAGMTVAKLFDGSGWRLLEPRLNDAHLDGLAYAGFTLKDYFSITLDPDRKPTGWTSVLARGTRFGDFQYAEAVHVTGYSSGRLLFEIDGRSPSLDVRSGTPVEGCVLQDTAGKLLGVFASCTEAEEVAGGRAALPRAR